ncbi:DUF3500 domain-containing protein [Yeosuana sp. MJ-SS3]|uniref:DUF3500 domain-containing protein n=1 Tax=Gilvirhabdus luticola TaxID=3079858 RepID=A0ABU3U9S1_9FLAO|nr:DUF3500 domain-containing protein [Yeosuana sp. MJ-SS3]MDU8887162.1 DUF3500 domain-containing protein [Yeosuana sp. MJ-SS3]
MKNITLAIFILFISYAFALNSKSSNPALDFLNSLSIEQKEKALLPFGHITRQEWHFLPGAMWPRAGIHLFELDQNQIALLFDLLKNNLSETGYDKTMKIIDLENVLAEMSGDTDFRDPEKYSIAFYGNPEKDNAWAWSFEGHHVSLNFTIVNGKVTIAPRFMGASPAIIQEGHRKGEKTLGQEEGLGLILINSLSDEQVQKAIFQKESFFDIVTSNATEVGPLSKVGIKISDLNDKQQNILWDLLDEYLSTMPTELAEQRMENLKTEELNDIRFGWAGSTQLGKPHYYRIQGKTFLVEFDNTQSNANHIHLVWRDFDGDFGRDLIAEHYKNLKH